MVAYESDAKLLGAVNKGIADRRQQLSQLSLVGDTVLEPNLKAELLEMDRRLDIFLNLQRVALGVPKDLESWRKSIVETLNQMVVIAKLIGDKELVIAYEAWLDVYKSEHSKEENSTKKN
jgi:hypothetical protein